MCPLSLELSHAHCHVWVNCIGLASLWPVLRRNQMPRRTLIASLPLPLPLAWWVARIVPGRVLGTGGVHAGQCVFEALRSRRLAGWLHRRASRVAEGVSNMITPVLWQVVGRSEPVGLPDHRGPQPCTARGGTVWPKIARCPDRVGAGVSPRPRTPPPA